MSDPLLSLSALARNLRGPLNFLRPDAGEILETVPDVVRHLPHPQPLYQADEAATPLIGFPVLATTGMDELREALSTAIHAEERSLARAELGVAPEPDVAEAGWRRYLDLLARTTENVTTSSHGRSFPDILWLQHSLDVARLLKETPQRITRLDSKLGRERGGKLKYQVFYRYIDRVFSLTYDLVDRLATDTEEAEKELFPALLTRMRDNVLIFTEDHVGPDLAELTAYLESNLGIDAKDFRYRLAKLAEWHARLVATDADFVSAVKHLTGADVSDRRALFKHRGYVAYLASRSDYDPRRHLDGSAVMVWERLLLKLKEFELFHALRRLIVPLHERGDGLYIQERSLNRTWIGPQYLRVSSATRPIDFMAPWVIDPHVERFGMIYDITDFSQIVSVLRRSGTELQDRSFRMMFRFQRKVNRFAQAHRLTLEKYLGDGAFFSSREAWRLLVVAVMVQRFYRQALDDGFPFNRGLRIALNFSEYRLLPIQGPQSDEPARYEFFGHGVVELSRLTTGKSMREIEEIKILLINMGYDGHTVHKFFAPVSAAEADLVDKDEERQHFYAYLNRNGKLVNEGIVATSQFVTRLAEEPACERCMTIEHLGREYVGLPLTVGEAPLLVAVRKLGTASLKGIDPVPVFEVRDADGWEVGETATLPSSELLTALDRQYARRLSQSEA